MGVTIEAARLAKIKAKELAAAGFEVVSIGITKLADDYAVKVALTSPPSPLLPSKIDGVAIVYDIVSRPTSFE